MKGWWLAMVAIAAGGCAARAWAPRPESAPAPEGSQFRAGLAEVDITPPLGLGLFGHGPESRIAVGTQLLDRDLDPSLVANAP